MTRVHIIGTGITALTLASRLQQGQLASNLQIVLFDKARAPGGRLTSRQYKTSREGHVVLEPGARAFQSTSEDFARQCEKWQAAGYLRELQPDQIRGVKGDGERWWEASKGGWSGSLIKGLVEQINAAGGDHVSWHYNTAAQPSSSGTLTFDPAVNTPRPDFIVYTAPSPQVAALLFGTEARYSEISYRKTFALMYPSVPISGLPAYWRDPHPSFSAISTGVDYSGGPQGLVIQASPEQLGVEYDRQQSPNEAVLAAFDRAMEQSGMFPEINLSPHERDLKRWKFAQVIEPPKNDILVWRDGEGPTVIIAGDGHSEKGGVEGGWQSANAAAQAIERSLAASSV